MRIIVLSDSHGRTDRLEKIVLRHRDADRFIHLGDCEEDLPAVEGLIKGRLLKVPGNCDFGSRADPAGETVLGGKRIFYTHGHLYHVKYGEDGLIGEARRRHADIVLYGHTHLPVSRYEDGLYIMNPGSIGRPWEGEPTYGIVDITPAGIVLNIAEVGGDSR